MSDNDINSIEIQKRFNDKVVIWTDERGCKQKATIQQLIRPGATSYVFRIIGDSLVTTPFVVKIPKPANDIEAEWKALDSLRKTDAKEFLPVCYRGHIDAMPDQDDVLVIEYLDVKNQWLALREGNRFELENLLAAGKQAAKVIAVSHSLGYANIDVKPENFYWVDNKRFVWIDWNQYTYKDPQGASDLGLEEKFSRDKRDNILTLLNLMYQMLTVSATLNPWPPVGAQRPNAWNKVPRPLQRAIVEANESAGITANTLADRLGWLEQLFGLKQAQNWSGLVKMAVEIREQKSDHESIENLERVQDILSFLPEEQLMAPAVIEIKNWVDSQHSSIPIEDAYQRTVEFVTNKKYKDAIEFLENSIRRQLPLEAEIAWPLAKWYAIVKRLSAILQKGLFIPKEVSVAVFWAEQNSNDALADNPDLTPDVQKSISEVQDALARAEVLVENSRQLHLISDVSSRLSVLKNTQKEMQEWKTASVFPALTLDVLQKRLSLWRIAELEKEIMSADIAGEQDEKFIAEKDKLKTILLASPEYPVREIDQLISRGGALWEQDPSLNQIIRVHQTARMGNWVDALRQIPDKLDPGSLFSQYRQALVGGALSELRGLDDKVLYHPDLLLAENLMECCTKDLEAANEFDKLSSRLKGAREAEWNNLDLLRGCLELHIEPWCESSQDLTFSVTNLIWMVELKSKQQEILREFNEANEISNKVNNLARQVNSDEFVQLIQQLKNVEQYAPLITKTNEVNQQLEEIKTLNLNQVRDDLAKAAQELENVSKDAKATLDKANQLLQDKQSRAQILTVQQTLSSLRDPIAQSLEKLDNMLEKARGLDTEIKNKIEEAKQLTEKITNQTEPLETSSRQISAELVKGQKLVGVIEYILDRIKSIGQPPIAPRYMEALVISSAVGYIGDGQYDEALNILDQASSDQMPHSIIVGEWQRHIASIENGPKIDSYKEWITALYQKNATKSKQLMLQLADEMAQPLYQYLCDRHLLFFENRVVSAIPVSAAWMELFKAGKLDQLFVQLEDFKPQTDYEEMELNEWRFRCYAAKEIVSLNQEVEKNGFAKGKKWAPWIRDVFPLIQMLFPEIWSAANTYKNANQSSR